MSDEAPVSTTNEATSTAPVTISRQGMPAQPPPPAAVPAGMKVGEVVQVRQGEFVTHLKRWQVYWIYARVTSVSDSGITARVSHPGNREHNQEICFDPDDVRTLADVQKLLDTARASGNTVETKSLQAQVDRLGIKKSVRR